MTLLDTLLVGVSGKVSYSKEKDMAELQITTIEGLTFSLTTNGKYHLTLSVGSTGSLTISSALEKAELVPLMGNEKFALHIGGSGTLVAVYLTNDEAKKVADFLEININL